MTKQASKLFCFLILLLFFSGTSSAQQTKYSEIISEDYCGCLNSKEEAATFKIVTKSSVKLVDGIWHYHYAFTNNTEDPINFLMVYVIEGRYLFVSGFVTNTERKPKAFLNWGPLIISLQGNETREFDVTDVDPPGLLFSEMTLIDKYGAQYAALSVPHYFPNWEYFFGKRTQAITQSFSLEQILDFFKKRESPLYLVADKTLVRVRYSPDKNILLLDIVTPEPPLDPGFREVQVDDQLVQKNMPSGYNAFDAWGIVSCGNVFGDDECDTFSPEGEQPRVGNNITDKDKQKLDVYLNVIGQILSSK